MPVRWAHHKLTVVGDTQKVRVMCKDTLIAEHPRDWGREQVRYDPVHYLALLERRPGAFDVARPLDQWDLPPCFGILRRKLEADWPPAPGCAPGSGGGKNRGHRPRGYLNGTTQFIQVLRLLEDASLGDLKAAVQTALELGTITPDAVKVILEGQREQPLAMFNLAGRPHLSHVHVALPDLNAYGVLLGSTGVTSGVTSGGAA